MSVVLVALPAWLGCSVLMPERNTESAPVSVQEGVFTDAQAARGERVFSAHCAECHFPLEYSGGYLNSWAGQSAWALYERLRTTMPYLQPATLAPQQYADAVALLLSLNGVPGGATELPADPDRLRSIVLDGPFR